MSSKRHRLAMRDLVFILRAFPRILLRRGCGEQLSAGGADRLAVCKGEFYLAMGCSRLPARNPIAPLRIHIVEIKIMRLEHMHIAIENFVTVLCHGSVLASSYERHFLVGCTTISP